MNVGAIIMLIFGCVFLYGGITYFTIIALRGKGEEAYKPEADKEESTKPE
jgi:hypothetical protein